MKQVFIMSAIGKDRPGIVADVTGLLYECGCNLEDSRMTLLGRHFALLILLSGEGKDLLQRLSRGCKRLEWEKDLTVFLSPFGPLEAGPLETSPVPDYELDVTGMDRAGIVYQTSKLLASKGINIMDLNTFIRPAPDSGSPIFQMRMKIVMSPDVDEQELDRELERLSDELHLDISLSRIPSPA